MSARAAENAQGLSSIRTPRMIAQSLDDLPPELRPVIEQMSLDRYGENSRGTASFFVEEAIPDGPNIAWLGFPESYHPANNAHPAYSINPAQSRTLLGGDNAEAYLEGYIHDLATLNRRGTYHGDMMSNVNITNENGRPIFNIYDFEPWTHNPRVTSELPTADLRHTRSWIGNLAEQSVLTEAEAQRLQATCDQEIATLRP